MQPRESEECCGYDRFITKLNADANQLIFSTYFGGVRGDDIGRGIAVDSNNNVHVVGYTSSYAFPTTNPIQPENNQKTVREADYDNIFDAYLAKIDAPVNSGSTRRTSAAMRTTQAGRGGGCGRQRLYHGLDGIDRE